MDEDAIFERIKRIIIKNFGVEENKIDLHSNLISDFNLRDWIILILAIEEEFEIEIPDKIATKICSIADAIECVINCLCFEYY